MILDGYKHNFETMLAAARNGDLALVECTDAKTGEIVIAVCIMIDHTDGSTDIMPVAKMFNGNPYEELIPPLDTEVTDVKDVH